MPIETTGAAAQELKLALAGGRLAFYEWTPDDDRLTLVPGPDPDQFLGIVPPTSRALIESVHEADHVRLREQVVAAMKGDSGPDIPSVQIRVRDSGGHWRWVEARALVAERDPAGRALRLVGSLTDITPLKQAHVALERVRDLYAMLLATNQSIARCADQASLFDRICRIAIEHGQFRLAWIGLIEEATGVVRPAMADGPAQEYLSSISVSVHADHPTGVGPFGLALRSGQPAVWNDFLNEPAAAPWRAAALRYGFRSVAVIPIFVSGQSVGGLALYSADPGFFDAALVKLLSEMANDIGFALERFASEHARARIAAELERSEALKASIMNTAMDPIMALDENGAIVTFNPAAERALGWSLSDVLGRSFIDILVPEEHRARRRLTYAHFVRTGESEFVNRRKQTVVQRRDGSVMPVEVSTTWCRVGERTIVTLYLRDITDLRKVESLLQDSVERYRVMLERLPEGILLHHEGRILFANQAATELLGHSAASALLGLDLYNFVRPDFRPMARERARRLNRESDTALGFTEQTWLRANGSEVILEVAASRVRFEDHDAHQLVLRDITERRRGENMQRRQNQVLSMIASDAEPPDIMRELVNFIEAESRRARASVMLLNREGTALSRIIAPSMSEGFRAEVDPQLVGPTSSVCGLAAYRGEPVIVRDIQQDPLAESLRDLARRHGVGAVASWPIMGKRGQILGTFALYYTDPAEPNGVEMALIAQATDLAGIAIESWLAEERIRHLAHYDELTGLPNRFLFNQFLEHALGQARRHGHKLATLFLDLDRFKNINDTFGHGVGDDVLREVSHRFRTCLRANDEIARMGGDEFIVLLDDIEAAHETTEVARRLLEQAARPLFVKGEECQLSASIGIAIFPDDGEDADTLLKYSDIAMYRAKGQGKNTFQFFSASQNTHSVHRLALESRLRRAIDNNEFVLHYQPRVDLVAGQVTGVEALVRWQHPERGLLAPSEFIPIAEESGLIVPLGHNILAMAAHDTRIMQARLGRVLRTAVNLSVRQLDAPSLVRDISELLRSARVSPRAIELEITESMLIQNPEQAERIVSELHDLGIGVSIDDFGTGYSSLTYLKRFPVETVKIDRSFVKDLPGDLNDMAITQAIIAMAHSLGLNVVAEGVETEAQVQTLRAMACDEFQGFLYSRPLPIEAVLDLLENLRLPV